MMLDLQSYCKITKFITLFQSKKNSMTVTMTGLLSSECIVLLQQKKNNSL